jgi:hypothetical protein
MSDEEKREKEEKRGEEGKDEKRKMLSLEPVETEHEPALEGRILNYTARAGAIPLKDDKDEIEAEVFFVAYDLHGVKVAAFDTRATEEELHSHGFILSKLVDVFGYAAEPIGDKLESKGGEPVLPPEGFYVEGTEGPLTEGELERAADWARHILAVL